MIHRRFSPVCLHDGQRGIYAFRPAEFNRFRQFLRTALPATIGLEFLYALHLTWILHRHQAAQVVQQLRHVAQRSVVWFQVLTLSREQIPALPRFGVLDGGEE